jgi:hypothetical protein
MRYRVNGIAKVCVSVEVELTEEEAKKARDEFEIDDLIMEKANDAFEIKAYIGNGGYDKLIGVEGKASIEAHEDSEVEFDHIEKLEK